MRDIKPSAYRHGNKCGLGDRALADDVLFSGVFAACEQARQKHQHDGSYGRSG